MKKEIFVLKGRTDNNGQLSITAFRGGREILKIEAECSDEDSSLNIAAELLRQSILNKDSDLPIIVEHDFLTDENIPVLCYYPSNGRKLPLVVFVHGYSGDKTSWDVGRCLKIAQQGYFTVMLDAREHGERKPDNFDELFAPERFAESFFKVVKETAGDITRLIDFFEGDDRVDTGRTGVMGTSMGGCITFMAAAFEKRIRAAAPMISTGDWKALLEIYNEKALPKEKVEYFLKYDPYARCNFIKPMAFLVQNGAEDKVMPPSSFKRFDEKMSDLYSDMPERYRFIEYPGVAHETPPEMFDRILEWFGKYL